MLQLQLPHQVSQQRQHALPKAGLAGAATKCLQLPHRPWKGTLIGEQQQQQQRLRRPLKVKLVLFLFCLMSAMSYFEHRIYFPPWQLSIKLLSIVGEICLQLLSISRQGVAPPISYHVLYVIVAVISLTSSFRV